MRFVTKAEMRPHACAVYPHLGSQQQEGYFDTGSNMPGPGVWINHIYVSVVAVKDMARKLNWISDTEAGELRAQIHQLEQERDEAIARADAAEAVVDAIDVIESEAFRARKKRGPKPREVING